MAETEVDPHIKGVFDTLAQNDLRQLFPSMTPKEWEELKTSPPAELQYMYKGKSGVLDIPKTLELPSMQERGVITDITHPDLYNLPEEYDIRNIPGEDLVHVRKRAKPPLVG